MLVSMAGQHSLIVDDAIGTVIATQYRREAFGTDATCAKQWHKTKSLPISAPWHER